MPKCLWFRWQAVRVRLALLDDVDSRLRIVPPVSHGDVGAAPDPDAILGDLLGVAPALPRRHAQVVPVYGRAVDLVRPRVRAGDDREDLPAAGLVVAVVGIRTRVEVNETQRLQSAILQKLGTTNKKSD